MDKLNLFQIQKEYLDINRELIESGGEITPELEKQLVLNQSQLATKAQGYVYVIKQNEGNVNIIEEEIKRLQELKRRFKNANDRLGSAVLNALELYELDKIEMPTMTIGTRKSSRLDITDEAKIPHKFIKIKQETMIDKNAIKEALKNGEKVKGVQINEVKHLSIK